jgi:hypothetical protein
VAMGLIFSESVYVCVWLIGVDKCVSVFSECLMRANWPGVCEHRVLKSENN